MKDAKYTFGRQAAFQCDPGYVLWGSRRAQCGSDGTWSPPVPFCDKGESGCLGWSWELHLHSLGKSS